mmetsp:Transcript_17395/g.24816  ORF Transcript_17395/g.24816 Transcript_17395/m.24816 type:complete len:81 (+) Transcript_17395:685-927(+)
MRGSLCRIHRLDDLETRYGGETGFVAMKAINDQFFPTRVSKNGEGEGACRYLKYGIYKRSIYAVQLTSTLQERMYILESG